MFPFLKFDTPERRAYALGLGPVHFVLLYGVVIWGGLMALTMTVFAPLLGFVPGPAGPLNYFEKMLRAAPLAFAVFPAFGLVWGGAMWFVMGVVEKKSAKITRK